MSEQDSPEVAGSPGAAADPSAARPSDADRPLDEAAWASDPQVVDPPDPDSAENGTGSTGPAESTDGGPTEIDPAEPQVVPHAGLRYSVMRLLVLLAVGAVLYVLGLRDWLLLISAFLISGIVSYFMLMRTRDAAAASLEATMNARRHHHEEHPDGQPSPTPEP